MTINELHKKLIEAYSPGYLNRIAIILLLLASSCQKEPMIRFGFDTDFDKNSRGLTIMTVNNSTEAITLRGDVFAAEGEVLIELVDPLGKTAFSSQVISPNILYVDESYQSISGNWKLKYKSLDGEGSIDLHLQTVKRMVD